LNTLQNAPQNPRNPIKNKKPEKATPKRLFLFYKKIEMIFDLIERLRTNNPLHDV